MSFDILAARMYGTGALGDVTNPTGQINSYAKVTSFLGKTIIIDLEHASLGAYEKFEAGTELLLHISGVRNSSASVNNLGKYKFVKIMANDGNTLTLNSKPLNVSTDEYFYQAITVAQFKNLTLTGTISPLAFDETNGYGGILVFKCSDTFALSGAINLADKGLQTAEYRPLLNQEQNGTLDTDRLSGYENYETVNHFVLNKGDGSCLIIAKEINCEDTARIGSPTLKGIQRCRGASDSANLPTGATNIGGSSILIVGEAITSFAVAIIAKYRSKTLEAGRGLARCYIATESQLLFDEGLYANDIINNPTRLRDSTLIKDFGSGIHGVAKTTDIVQNSYAKVQSISGGGKTFELANITTDGAAKFERNALVMIHAQSNNSKHFMHVGRFMLAKVINVSNDSSGKLKSITLDHSLNELKLGNFNTDTYTFQAIAIPQYTSFSASNSRTPKFEKSRGGIFAIAVNGTCDLTGKTIDVMKKGGSKYYSQVSNAGMKNCLPIGEGHGSVFILAKTLKVNSSTRLGATYTGNAFGGGNYNVGNASQSDGGYLGKRTTVRPLKSYYGYGGGGYRGGQQEFGHNGGYFSNSTDGAPQGASLFIVAETLDGLCLDCLSTGGQRGSQWRITSSYSGIELAGKAGGCGYGGAGCGVQDLSKRIYGAQGGVHGGGAGASNSNDSDWSSGGGSSGFCCIYANQIVSQNTTNITVN